MVVITPYPLFALVALVIQATGARGTTIPVLIDGQPARDLHLSIIAGDEAVSFEPSTGALTIALEELAGMEGSVVVAATDGQRRCAAYFNGSAHAAGHPIQLYWEDSDPEIGGLAEQIDWSGPSPRPKGHDGYPGRGDGEPNVTGRVLDLAGHPVPGAYVSATPQWSWPNHPQSTFTDSSGRFQFHFGLVRSVKIRAFSGAAAGIVEQGGPDGDTPKFPTVDVTLDQTAWSDKTILVLNLNREPVQGARVSAGRSPSTFSAVTDEDGLATLPMLVAPRWAEDSISGWGADIEAHSIRPMDRANNQITLSTRRTDRRRGFLDLALDRSAREVASEASPSELRSRSEASRRALYRTILALPSRDDRSTSMRITRLASVDAAAARSAFDEWRWQDHRPEAEAYVSLPEHLAAPIPDGLEPLTRRLAYATAAWVALGHEGRGDRAQAARRLASETTEELIASSSSLSQREAPEIDAWTRALATHIPREANAIRRRLNWGAATRPPTAKPAPITPAESQRMIQNGSFQVERDLPRVMAEQGSSLQERLAILLDPAWESMTAAHWLALRQLAKEPPHLDSPEGHAALGVALEECLQRSDLFAFGGDTRAARAAALAAMQLIRPALAKELARCTTDELLEQVKRTLKGSLDRSFKLDSELLEASLNALVLTSMKELEAWVQTDEFAAIGAPRFLLADAVWNP